MRRRTGFVMRYIGLGQASTRVTRCHMKDATRRALRVPTLDQPGIIREMRCTYSLRKLGLPPFRGMSRSYDTRSSCSFNDETVEATTSPSRERETSSLDELQLGESDEIYHSPCRIKTSRDSEQSGERTIGAGTSTSPEPVRPAARRATQQVATHIPEPADNKPGRLDRTRSQTQHRWTNPPISLKDSTRV